MEFQKAKTARMYRHNTQKRDLQREREREEEKEEGRKRASQGRRERQRELPLKVCIKLSPKPLSINLYTCERKFPESTKLNSTWSSELGIICASMSKSGETL